MGADQTIRLIAKGQEGVEEKSEDIHRGQQGREMLIAATEVMFEIVALGFQRVIVLVFDLPAGAARGDDTSDVLIGDFKIGDEGIFVKLSAILVGDGDLAPIELIGTLISLPQSRHYGNGVEEASG